MTKCRCKTDMRKTGRKQKETREDLLLEKINRLNTELDRWRFRVLGISLVIGAGLATIAAYGLWMLF